MTDLNAPVITIDGPGGSGKGTIAHRIAHELEWRLLDSGALYRLLALAALKHGVDTGNEEALRVLAAHLDVQFVAGGPKELPKTILEGEDVTHDIRTEEMGTHASKVAAFPAVREALLSRQRAFQEMPGLVADGRDMGTVVFTDAPLKIYLNASAEERANRRHKQLKAKGHDVSVAALIQEIRERDDRDMNRPVAPLRPAEDAIQIDSTSMSIEEVLNSVLEEARNRSLI